MQASICLLWCSVELVGFKKDYEKTPASLIFLLSAELAAAGFFGYSQQKQIAEKCQPDENNSLPGSSPNQCIANRVRN
jgi:hypothetical protein